MCDAAIALGCICALEAGILAAVLLRLYWRQRQKSPERGEKAKDDSPATPSGVASSLVAPPESHNASHRPSTIDGIYAVPDASTYLPSSVQQQRSTDLYVGALDVPAAHTNHNAVPRSQAANQRPMSLALPSSSAVSAANGRSYNGTEEDNAMQHHRGSNRALQTGHIPQNQVQNSSAMPRNATDPTAPSVPPISYALNARNAPRTASAQAASHVPSVPSAPYVPSDACAEYELEPPVPPGNRSNVPPMRSNVQAPARRTFSANEAQHVGVPEAFYDVDAQPEKTTAPGYRNENDTPPYSGAAPSSAELDFKTSRDDSMGLKFNEANRNRSDSNLQRYHGHREHFNSQNNQLTVAQEELVPPVPRRGPRATPSGEVNQATQSSWGAPSAHGVGVPSVVAAHGAEEQQEDVYTMANDAPNVFENMYARPEKN